MTIRKHKGINQKTGQLKPGFKYSGKRLKSGLPQIVKVTKPKRKTKQKGGEIDRKLLEARLKEVNGLKSADDYATYLAKKEKENITRKLNKSRLLETKLNKLFQETYGPDKKYDKSLPEICEIYKHDEKKPKKCKDYDYQDFKK